MSNVTRFPQRRDHCTDVASSWIAAIERGLTEEEEKELGLWLAEDRRNHELFMELATLWDQMDVLHRLADIFPEPKKRKAARTTGVAFAVAASIVAALTLFAVLQMPDTRTPETENNAVALQSLVFETVIGEQETFNLPDGTELVLNTNSLVRTNYSPNNRILRLERGEIHVSVAHDPARPLSVVVGNTVVQAVGTEFNIEITQDQSIELMVTDGVVMVGVIDTSVKAASTDSPILLTQGSKVVGAGEKAVISADELSAVAIDSKPVQSNEIAVELSWREGNLIFQGESLEEAVYEVGRYTAVEFVILDEDAKRVRVAGMFKAGDVEGLLSALRNHFNITYEWDGTDKILLSAD